MKMCREKSSVNAAAIAALSLVLLSLVGQCYGQLQRGFYIGKCMSNRGGNDDDSFDFFGGGDDDHTTFTEENVEKIVAQEVAKEFSNDKTLAAALLRLQFHDCFVEGCDASIMLEGSSSEKSAGPNKSVRGYDVIERIKQVLERTCAGVVSCSDIIALATRDAVALASGGKVTYSVKTGRRDGFDSDANKALQLPGPTTPVSQSIELFKQKGLDVADMVLLLGAHTVGITHCGFFQDRLYTPDPTMDPKFREALKTRCPQDGSGGNNSVVLDQGTPMSVDKSYFDQLLRNRGILQIDQDLATSGLTNKTVIEIAIASNFALRFGQAMVKLGEVGVKTTTDHGEIRSTCGAINFI